MTAIKPYFDDGQVSLYVGDCLDVLAGLPDGSVDAVVTDPPYNLSGSSERDSYCLRRVIAEFALPDDDERDAERFKRGRLASPPRRGAQLGWGLGAVRVVAGIGVPVGPVDFKGAAVAEQEVNAGHVAATSTPDASLPGVCDAERGESLGGYVLKLADGGDASFCNGTCSCFTEPGAGLVAVPVAFPGATGGDLAGSLLPSLRRGDEDVRLGDDAGREAEAPAGVLARGRAETRAVLCLDLTRRTGELRIANGAGQREPLFLLEPALSVGAGTRTGGLPTVAEPAGIGLIGVATDGAFSLHFPWHALNLTRRSGGFMGKEWDGWGSPASFQRWCFAWASECLRVLKPGGHLLAFGGARTWHRLACAVEDAGFEIRDSAHWIYGSGFPKSKNLGSGRGTALKPAHEPIVVARRPFAGTVAANVAEHGTGAMNIDGCRVAFAGAADLAETEGKNRHADYDSGPRENSIFGDMGQHSRAEEGNYDGSAGRWPPNVLLTHSANCQPTGLREVRSDGHHPASRGTGGLGTSGHGGQDGLAERKSGTETVGAWSCADDCPVAELDRQSGNVKAGGGAHGTSPRSGTTGAGIGPGSDPMERTRNFDGYGDAGGASRFFPAFRWQAKAPASERPRLDDGTAHPTVKPVELMRWLVRLVTPPGGLVLDPFGGSGTTAEACLIEGFRCILAEKDPAHAGLIMARIAKPIQPDLFGGAA